MITMYKIYNPPECEAQNDCLHPAWRSKKEFKHQVRQLTAKKNDSETDYLK